MSDIRLQVRVKSARILRAMERAGYDTIAALARAIDRQNGPIGDLINFRARPINKDGEWRPLAVEVATALHVEPEDLWPQYLRDIEAKKTETHIDVSVEQFQAIAGGERSLLDTDQVKHLMARLPVREAEIINYRFGLNGNGEHTLAEVGELFGLSRERIRALETRALTRMRFPKGAHA